MLKSLMTFLFLLPFSLAVTSAWAALNLTVTQGVSQAIPVAVVPFANDNLGISSVIASDLHNSGMFAVLANDQLPAQPTTIADVQFGDWRAIPVNDLVIGDVKAQANGEYKVSFLLLDSFKSQQFLHFGSVSAATVNAQLNPILSSGRFTITDSSARAMAHYIADKIYRQLTGIDGVFSTRIAYVSVWRKPNHRTRYGLMVADADGHHAQPLLRSFSPIMSPVWSPNGKQIAYVSFENHRPAIYISDLSNGQRQRISAFPGINSSPAWSPDGKRLAVALSKGKVNPNIYVINLSNHKLRQITSDQAINTSPDWSPDGKSIIFTSDRSGGPQIYRIDLSTQQITRLTHDGNYNADASFTPDGKRIVLLHRDQQGKYQIAVENLATQTVQLLTTSGFNDSPSISANGQMILYSDYYKSQRGLAEVSIDGNVHIHLVSATGGDAQSPDWGPLT